MDVDHFHIIVPAQHDTVSSFHHLVCTGSEQQQFDLRSAIIYHMLSFPHMFAGNGADGLPNCMCIFCLLNIVN